ncbi:unnamed protein product [Knipowitschia caucasica]
MKTSVLLCVLASLLVSSILCSRVGGPADCCFHFYPRRIRREKIQSYTQTDERCTRTGVVLLTLRNISLCADPNLSWVQNIMRDLDEKSL